MGDLPETTLRSSTNDLRDTSKCNAISKKETTRAVDDASCRWVKSARPSMSRSDSSEDMDSLEAQKQAESAVRDAINAYNDLRLTDTTSLRPGTTIEADCVQSHTDDQSNVDSTLASGVSSNAEVDTSDPERSLEAINEADARECEDSVCTAATLGTNNTSLARTAPVL